MGLRNNLASIVLAGAMASGLAGQARAVVLYDNFSLENLDYKFPDTMGEISGGLTDGGALPDNGTYTSPAVPEPAETMALYGVGALCLVGLLRRKKRQ